MKKNNDSLTPAQIVKELDKYIIGQEEAKKDVAIAIRNRWRREKVNGKIKEEILPANIILIGPTGVGKTEMARRLSTLVNAPFVKVEATKFTEIGYVGRDVESIIRELTNIGVNMVKAEKMREVEPIAKVMAEERILDALLSKSKNKEARESMRDYLEKGKLDNKEIEISVETEVSPPIEVFAPGLDEINTNIKEMFSSLLPKKKKKTRMTIKEAKRVLLLEEAQKLIDMDKVIEEAKYRVENLGIVFIDEIDKIVGRGEVVGPEVSRVGVQRDLLPIVEGCSVMTKYGVVKTDKILFFSAGAFTNVKPSDLIPELQGRFPIRVEFHSLTKKDFERILIEPENALVKQYKALFKAEGINLTFTQEAISKIAEFAEYVNETTENIGARRLHTIMAALLRDYLFEIPNGPKKITIDEKYVENKLKNIVKDRDLTKYIL